MQDYDPKSIPILDDIIEEENNGNEQVSPDVTENEGARDDSSPDLFAAAQADIDATDITGIRITTMEADVESAEPAIADIDRFIGTVDDTRFIGAETGEPALGDDRTEDLTEVPGETVLDQPHQASAHDLQPYTLSADSGVAETDGSNRPAGPMPPLDIDALVDDIVTQMLPALEQQMRQRLQQALAEKLPVEIRQQSSPKNHD